MYSVVVNRYLSSSSFQFFPLLLVLSLTFSVGGKAIFALSLSQCRAVMWGDFAPSKFCCSAKFDLLGGLCLSILFFQGYTYISLQLNFCKISQKQLRKLRIIFYCIFRSYIICITLQYFLLQYCENYSTSNQQEPNQKRSYLAKIQHARS